MDVPAHGQALSIQAALLADPVSGPDKHARVQALYREHRGGIARHLLAMTGDATVVDDLVNETFIRAFQALDAFAERSSVSTWLHGIAINVARNHLAKRRRRALADETQPAPSTASPTPEDELAKQRAIARFYAALDRLEPALREVFVLRVVEQRPLKDIAGLLSIPLSTVHARVRRAEALVKAELEGEGVR